MLKHLFVAALCSVLWLRVEAQQPPTPNSPDFDPIANMRKFHPNWNPPEVSQSEIEKHPLGSAKNPVRAQGPNGQAVYLASLRCKNGKAPTYSRVGMVGTSPYGFHMDAYQVKCGMRKQIVHMDFYHPRHQELSPVQGFTMADGAEL
jgi:hypothetical protein